MTLGVVLGLQMAVRADVLLWQVEDPTIESWGNKIYSIEDLIPGPDHNVYSLNGARVAAKDANGDVSYLSVYNTQTGSFDLPGVGLNKGTNPAVNPIWAGVLPEDSSGWSFAIELGFFESVDGSVNWTAVASSGFEVVENLRAFIGTSVKDMPGYAAWSPSAYAAPEPSSGLLLLLGGALLALRRKRPGMTTRKGAVALAAGVLAVGGASAAPVVSSNIHGLVRIEPTTTNTIISVPWTGYTADGKPTRALLANRLVSPKGLTVGDLLMQVTNEVAYAAWSLEETDGTRAWQPVMSASRGADALGQTRNEILTHDGNGSVERGRGIWLIRQNPLKADGSANPVYLYGQWTNAGRAVEIPGVVLGKTQSYGGYDVCTYTMLANPDCAQATPINAIGWDADLVGANDTIVIPNDQVASKVLFWDEKAEKWYYTTTEPMPGMPFLMHTVKVYDAEVPAGAGFWYVRRAADPLYVIWPGATMQKQTMDVEIPEGEEK